MRVALMQGIVVRARPEWVVLRGFAVLAGGVYRGSRLPVRCSACPVWPWAAVHVSVDTHTGCGSLIYHRCDGYYGLVVPARERD
jgi:hypothetical protein